ncbi:hypothetical protein [Saccharicrinis fermentans]|uniref:Uncharacterized protein n=1 Tax=Saccharicrinis fermentans DSM 9555 = JCM 21142 TaxID=869213 RepID=W7YIZ6_9BACT|nr:hypothetical protein [Saccharicrinis fermentans]GAF04451.1 hypothetical protein JCM21142_83158 [Saccharicrinis fermentans DSM 9555 = JCM 21142]
MKIYDYIFYKVYQILSAFDESPCFITVIVLCWLFLFNSFTVIDYVIQNEKLSAFFTKPITISYGVFFTALHFLYFYHKGRYLKIIEKFQRESKHASAIGFISISLYIFLTVWIFAKYTVPNMAGVLK